MGEGVLKKTDLNLWTAFIGEAKANRIYTAYAMKAMEEEHPEVAQIFLEVAGAETAHALSHLKVAGEVKSTEENLKRVLEEEAYEIDVVYPKMIREAERENRPDAVQTFRIAWEREKHHVDLFRQALDGLRRKERKGVPSTFVERKEAKPASPYPRSEISLGEVSRERGRIAALVRIREVIFGAQDGLISTAAVASSVFAAFADNRVVIFTALAAALAGMISMAAGSYLSSKAEKEVQVAEIESESREIEEHPAEELAELMEIYRREGLGYEEAERLAQRISSDKQLWLKTLVEKELGLNPETPTNPVKDASTMGISFSLGAVFPIVPYTFLKGSTALISSVVAALLALFLVGVVKAGIVRRHPLLSGLEMLAIGSLSAGLGYLLGTIIPGLLGISLPLS